MLSSDSPHHSIHPSQADTVQSAPPPVVAVSTQDQQQTTPTTDEGEDIRTVKLFKEPSKSLGISIVGGKS